MDMNQLSRDADAVKPRERPASKPPHPAPARPEEASELWTGETTEGDYAPTERRPVTQRITVMSPLPAADARVEPTLGDSSAEKSARKADEAPSKRAHSAAHPPVYEQATETVRPPELASPQVVPGAAIMEVPKQVVEAEPELDQVQVREVERTAPEQRASAGAQFKASVFKEVSAKGWQLLNDAFAKQRAKSAQKKEAKKQFEEDEKNKKASIKKRNYALPVALGVVALVVAAFAIKSMLSDIEKQADVNGAVKPSTPAIADATALLTGGEPNSTQTSPQQPTAAVASASNAGEAPTQFSPPPSPSNSDDPYAPKLAQLRGLKEKMQNDPSSGFSPTGLPAEIDKQKIPMGGSRRAGARAERNTVAVASEPPTPIPDDIEAATKAPEIRRDPLDRVSVLGKMAVERGGVAPYRVGQIRPAQRGHAAYMYPKNSDPLLSGRWYQVGDQTDDEWTVVAISASGVNVVSPKGRVFEIN